MTTREILENALGVAIVLALGVAVIGVLLLAVGAVPLLLAVFPLTIAILGAILSFAYLRHRRVARRQRSGHAEGRNTDRGNGADSDARRRN